MSINPVSGVPSVPGEIPQNANNAIAASGAILLGRLADTAGSMAVSGASAVGSAQAALMEAELQAVTDLSKIHLYLFGANPDPTKALAAANDFMALAQKYGFTGNNADPNISALTTQVQNYFQISNNQVVGFQNDANGKTINDWWGTGTTTNNQMPGVMIAFNALESFLKTGDISFGPGLPSMGYPDVYVNICVIYADLLSTPMGKALNGVTFWSAINPDTQFSPATVLPYAMATYAQYMQSTGQGNANDMMNNMFSLLSEVTPFEGVGSTAYDAMLTEFSALKTAMQSNPGGLPLPQVPGPLPLAYSKYSQWASRGGNSISDIYSMIFSKMYIAWKHT